MDGRSLIRIEFEDHIEPGDFKDLQDGAVEGTKPDLAVHFFHQLICGQEDAQARAGDIIELFQVYNQLAVSPHDQLDEFGLRIPRRIGIKVAGKADDFHVVQVSDFKFHGEK